jgi:hypothetical protein
MIPGDLRVGASRALSKSGSLAAFRPQLIAIAHAQTKEEVAEFYGFLRDSSQRWESEWRPEFLAIFPVSEADIPKIDDADRWSTILHVLVAEGDLTKVRRFIADIGVPDWDFSPEEASPEIDIYPIDDADETGEIPVAKARRLGHIDVARYLEDLKRKLTDRYREKWQSTYEKRG